MADTNDLFEAAEIGDLFEFQHLPRNKNIDALLDDRGNTLLSIAANHGHKKVVALLVAEHGANINVQNKDGETPLSRAARNGHMDVVEILLKNIINIDPNHYEQAIYGAAENGHEDMVTLLLENNDIDPSTKNKYASTAIAPIAENGKFDFLKHLLAKYEVDLSLENANGLLPLNITAQNGRRDVVELLLGRHNININAIDRYGKTALHRAASSGARDIVELLLGRHDIDINAVDKYGDTALHDAFRLKREDIVELLLARHDIDIHAIDKYGRTALHQAAFAGMTAIVQLLLARDDLDVNAKGGKKEKTFYDDIESMIIFLGMGETDFDPSDTSQWTALDWAIQMGHLSVIELLLAKKDIDWDANEFSLKRSIRTAARSGSYEMLDVLLARQCAICPGRSPLSMCAENGNIEALECLLRRGVNENSKDGGGRTPISRGAEKGHQHVVELLLSYNADANLRDGDGKTPLLWAAENSHEASVELLKPVDTGTLFLLTQNGNQAAIELLLRFKPRLDQRSQHGQTALHLAALLGHLSIARTLISQGAEIDPKDNYGMTPLQLAMQRKQTGLIQELLEHKAHTKGIMAKEWRDAYGKQYDATILLCETAKGEHYLTFPTTFLTSEELSQPTSKIKNRLYLLTDDLHCPIWSRLPVPKLEQGQLKPNDLQILMRRNKDNTLDFSISLWLPIKQYLHDQTAKIDDQKLHRIAWKILRPTKPGNSWTPILYLSTLPYGWIPDSEMDLFEQFLRHINAQWLELCHMLEERLSKRGVQQLEFKGKNPEMMDNLAKEAQYLANLRIIPAGQISAAKEFLKLYCPHYSGSQIPQGVLELLNNDIGLDIGRRLTELEQRVRDLLHIEFAWITINETRISTKLGQNVMLLTYVSIFYLPLGFCAALWAIPNISEMSTRTPFILTATIVSLVTLLVTFNMEKIAATIQQGYQVCGNYISNEWKQKKKTQDPNLP